MPIPPFGAPPSPWKKTGTLLTPTAGVNSITHTPAADSASALLINRNAGTDVLTVDSVNSQTAFRGINDLATVGAEQLAQTGSFDNATYWTLPGPEWVGTATTLTATAASSTVLATAANFPAAVVGTAYRIAFRSTSVTAGSFTLNIGGAISIPISTNSGFGTSLVLVAITTAGFSIVGTGFTGVIQGLSIKPITTANAVVRFKGSAATLLGEYRAGGTNNVGFGLNCLVSNVSGQNNTALGTNALRTTQSGSSNTGVGANTLGNLGLGATNLALGFNALANLYSGSNNVAIGANAMAVYQVGSLCTAVGPNALTNSVSGANNVAIGGNAGSGVTTGGSNLLLGNSAGTNITTGSSNIIIGGVSAPSAATSNYLSVGDVLKGDLSLKIVGANVAPSGNGSLQVQAGSSAVPAKVGGVLFDHFADAGNTTTTETDLYSDSIAGSTLINNGDKLQAQYGGTFVSSATATREVRLYFGGTAIFDTGALTLSLSSSWALDVLIMRVDAATVRYKIDLTTQGAALSAYTAAGQLAGLTLTAANILKITGQAAGTGAATNDIVAKIGLVEWKSAA